MPTRNIAWPSGKVHRTTLIAMFCGSLLCGLGLVQAGWNMHGVVWAVVSCALLIGCYGRVCVVAVPAAVLAGVVFGVWRGTDMQVGLAVYANYIDQKVTITGTVIDDAGYGDKGQRDMRLRDVQFDGRSPPGVVRVTSHTMSQPRRGDVVQATGKLREGFGNYQGAIYFGELRIVSVNQNPAEALRRQFAAGVYSVMPDLQASLGLGVLMGIKTQLSDELDSQLKTLALTHIVVASGYNLTVLMRLARRLFEKRSKFQTLVVGSSLMSAFVVVTGFSPSMTRAALVSGLSLLAWYFGRRVHPVVLLLFVAALTAGINPLYVWGDLGWWLSFLAFAGVLLVAPLLEHRLFGEKRPKLVGQLVIETSAAQITTLPLTLAIFGNLSILGLPANVLIVPLIPLAMLFTLVGGVAAAIIGPLGAYVAVPAVWLLTYITSLIAGLSAIPWAATTLKIEAWMMLVLYGILAGVCILIWRKTRHDFMGRSVIE
ncbi:MAG TPA: ComEC/Rec2 family competence protein [Candidatus Saccharimonadales bacterium]|nr:ComEC/Rec2 family competence protein [Candidatus Saccharimonadales bacterium]